MRSACFNLGLVLSAITCAFSLYAAQISAPVESSQAAQSVKIYSAGPGIKAPVLISQAAPATSAKTCKPIFQVVVELTLIVDTEGRPRNIHPMQQVEKELNGIALQIVAHDLFKPGLFQGQPVPVGRLVDVSFPVCYQQPPNPAATREHMLAGATQTFDNIPFPPDAVTLAPLSEPANSTSNSIQLVSGTTAVADDIQEQQSIYLDLEKAGKDVTEPRLIYSVPSKYPQELVKKFVVEICIVELTVDPQGMPRYLHLFRHQNPLLDQIALASVLQYRFRPAMKNGRPVAVPMAIEIQFHPGRN
jgi:hypothetical protein